MQFDPYAVPFDDLADIVRIAIPSDDSRRCEVCGAVLRSGNTGSRCSKCAGIRVAAVAVKEKSDPMPCDCGRATTSGDGKPCGYCAAERLRNATAQTSKQKGQSK